MTNDYLIRFDIWHLECIGGFNASSHEMSQCICSETAVKLRNNMLQFGMHLCLQCITSKMLLGEQRG